MPARRWQLTITASSDRTGYANPNGFDVEAWLLENNLRATGSVRGDDINRLLATNAGRPHPIDYLNRLRDLRERMQNGSPVNATRCADRAGNWRSTRGE